MKDKHPSLIRRMYNLFLFKRLNNAIIGAEEAFKSKDNGLASKYYEKSVKIYNMLDSFDREFFKKEMIALKRMESKSKKI